MTKKLTSGTEKQKRLATMIRQGALRLNPWGLDVSSAKFIEERINKITSSMFFIKYQEEISRGDVVRCLNEYDRENLARRTKFYNSKK